MVYVLMRVPVGVVRARCNPVQRVCRAGDRVEERVCSQVGQEWDHGREERAEKQMFGCSTLHL